MEDLLYEVESVRRFASAAVHETDPELHLLETQGLGMGLFEEINRSLSGIRGRSFEHH